MQLTEILSNPTRMRIIQYLAGHKEGTAKDLAAYMPDVPRRTLYRHINLLVEADAIRVKKAVCAVADALCYIDTQRRAGAASTNSDGKVTGAIASISSGKESVSYATGGTASVYSAAASNTAAQDSYTRYIVETYLANVPDANGVNLLYAGVD